MWVLFMEKLLDQKILLFFTTFHLFCHCSFVHTSGKVLTTVINLSEISYNMGGDHHTMHSKKIFVVLMV